MTNILILLILLGTALWAFTRFYLRGADLSRFDRPIESRMSNSEPSQQHVESVKAWEELAASMQVSKDAKTQLDDMRRGFDEMGKGVALTGVQLQEVDAGGVAAEWVLAEGADPNRRLLYIHGGAFTAGSPTSHRSVTTSLSKLAGASVLAIDYRLTPEHPRLACVEDCQAAYRWILEHGPNVTGEPDALFIAGDSAGGNLTLVTTAWARDAGLRAVDAAVALSPATDSTFSLPSMRTNVATDSMLGPMLGQMTKWPTGIVVWGLWMATRIRPSDPRISPIFGDLAALPPTLIHASEAEVLFDDARCYVNKALDAGSKVTLQTWPHMLHVWQMFGEMPEAKDALAHIGRFLDSCSPRSSIEASRV